MMSGGFKSTQCSWGCSELSGMTQAVQSLNIKSCKCSVFPAGCMLILQFVFKERECHLPLAPAHTAVSFLQFTGAPGFPEPGGEPAPALPRVGSQQGRPCAVKPASARGEVSTCVEESAGFMSSCFVSCVRRARLGHSLKRENTPTFPSPAGHCSLKVYCTQSLWNSGSLPKACRFLPQGPDSRFSTVG